mmetsp:Transcript_36991/g.78901  ORF Transcript_36991/g.78901 Transcript_36991/m.78901 type:complete len:148 (+) Transcript_36991:1055-1498(+)
MLRRDEIECYSVVTYEALRRHDEVAGELLEVVRSGMAQHGSSGRGRDLSGRTESNTQQSKRGKIANRPSKPQRRRLHLHHGKQSDRGVVDASYLAPKKESVLSEVETITLIGAMALCIILFVLFSEVDTSEQWHVIFITGIIFYLLL